MYPPHPDLIQLINVNAVQELILWLDHAVNKVYRLSALMTYILSPVYYVNELCMMLPAGVHPLAYECDKIVHSNR